MNTKTVEDFRNWLGKENLSFFRHLKGLTGSYSPVLRLNASRKGIPAHSVHFREGMDIRNWMRGQEEFKNYSSQQLDDSWTILVEKACNIN